MIDGHQTDHFRLPLIKDIFTGETQCFSMLLDNIVTMETRNGQPYRTGQFALTPKEYERVLDACTSLEDEVLIKFTVATGLRREDVVNVELQNITIDSTTGSPTGKVRYFEKKKGNRIREVPIGGKLAQLIIKYQKTLPKAQTTLFRFSGRTAHRYLQRLCDTAQIPRRPFHALRATCIKRCQAAGWTPEEVCELTGDTLRVIQEHYATPSEGQMRETAVQKETI